MHPKSRPCREKLAVVGAHSSCTPRDCAKRDSCMDSPSGRTVHMCEAHYAASLPGMRTALSVKWKHHVVHVHLYADSANDCAASRVGVAAVRGSQKHGARSSPRRPRYTGIDRGPECEASGGSLSPSGGRRACRQQRRERVALETKVRISAILSTRARAAWQATSETEGKRGFTISVSPRCSTTDLSHSQVLTLCCDPSLLDRLKSGLSGSPKAVRSQLNSVTFTGRDIQSLSQLPC